MTKEYASFPLETMARGSTKGRTMVGYASAFNVPIVHDEDDQIASVFAPGAWTKTLQEHAEEVQVLLNHGQDPTFGLKPLGKPEVMRQDSYGLWTETPIAETSWGNDVIELLKTGALRSMSVTFEPKEVEYSDDRKLRTIRQARLYEFGPVTFPANPGASARLNSADPFSGVSSAQAEDGNREGRGDAPPTFALLTWIAKAKDQERQALELIEAQRRAIEVL